ncbi:hypothetical protein FVF61_05225 [Formosa maritima]|uniref:META domain-containing protein n=1 Tax=Formosa maritima TaxID=2592046 RepID=A0A5D0GGE1_9FLAO|nr:hypothetical protein FVF61_05225 [Formosa maritima]
MFSLSLLSSTCSHHDDDDVSPNNNSGQIQQIENQVESGTWRITSFIDSGQDETSDFNGFNFAFQSNGTLIASHNSGSNLTGSWSITDSNSNDDSSDDIDFNIFFNVPDSNNFEDLNDDWDIISHSDNTIQLRDVSGGNGGTDTLTFQRN